MVSMTDTTKNEELLEECTHDCSSCGANCASRQAPEDLIEKLHPSASVKKVIGVISGKGGVGKSMVTSMLAVTMARRGRRTAILDADITGPSIPTAFGLHSKAMGTETGLLPVLTKSGIQVMSINLLLEDERTPVVWRGPVIAGAVKQFWTDVIWDDVDYMFVDMPPGTGDVPLTVFQSLPIDGIVVVTSPQELVQMVVSKAVNMARLMDVPILGLVENMSYVRCPDCGKTLKLFGESHLEETAKLFQLDVLAQLPMDPTIATQADQGLLELFEGDYLEHAADVIEQKIALPEGGAE